MGSGLSVSTQIGTLRRLLLAGADKNIDDSHHDNLDIKQAFHDVAHGCFTLAVEAHSADIISSLVLLKSEIEHHTHSAIKMTITHASEAHLLAAELAAANIGVVLVNSRPFPSEWQDHRILPSPPLSKDSQIAILHWAGVKVANGVKEVWDSRNTALYLGWAALEANGTIGRSEALAMGSSNVRELLGVEGSEEDLVITRGGDVMEMGAKVVGVVESEGVVSLF
jgi:hypothetical protein